MKKTISVALKEESVTKREGGSRCLSIVRNETKRWADDRYLRGGINRGGGRVRVKNIRKTRGQTTSAKQRS